MLCQSHKPITEPSKQYAAYNNFTYQYLYLLLLVLLSFLRARINVSTKDSIESKLLVLMNRIEFDSICLKHRFFIFYRENTVLRIVNVFFSDRNSAHLAIIQSTSTELQHLRRQWGENRTYKRTLYIVYNNVKSTYRQGC